MNSFAAIDFETANNERTSVCSVGVVIVKEGEFVDSFYSLIQPEPNYYLYWNTLVHGITKEDTEDAPVFPYVWQKIEPLIEALKKAAADKNVEEIDKAQKALQEKWFPIASRIYQASAPQAEATAEPEPEK